MAHTVLAFVGENANGILDCQSQRFLALLEPLGFKGRTLRFSNPDFIAQLDDALGAGIAFA